MMRKKQLFETIELSIFKALANVHTATIARVVKVGQKTIDVQPVIARVVKGQSIELTVFTKVPPVFMQGGASHTTYPIAVGDYCLLIFTERCFDRWYAGQDGQAPAEFRMHDYSDGLAIVGVNPLASALTIPDVITQIGDTYQEGNYEHLGNVTQTGDKTQTGNYTLTGDQEVTGNVTINGNLTVNGNINCTGTLTVPTINTATVAASTGVTIAGIEFGTHAHSGVQSGTDTSGGPV